MKTPSKSVTTLVFFLFISRSLATPLSYTLSDAMALQKPIRHSGSLCAGEQEYIVRRKQVVLESLLELGLNGTMDSVPHIALLASGGGQRAAVGLVGSLHQMGKDGLLDPLLYLGGVSGSTWSMASVYSDPEWSSNMEAAMSRLSGDGVTFEQALGWLAERATEENFSLSDVWGVLTSAGIMRQMDLRHLSDEARRNVTNPYPIYSALEKECFSGGQIEGNWFEVSPHEAGFTELDLFVNTSLLGSKFKKGELLEVIPEMDIIKLQGLLGCALAHEEMVGEVIPQWLKVDENTSLGVQEYFRLYKSLDFLLTLVQLIVKDPAVVSDLDKLKKDLYEEVHRDESALLKSKNEEERKSLFQQWRGKLLTVVENWSQNLEEGSLKSNVSVLIAQVLPLIVKWEWGTTSNFLYQYQTDSSLPTCLNKERLHLVDAGALINVAYPPFLGDKRDIDLIIAPEYSAGNMFETLTLARDYAAKVGKPFPAVEDNILQDRDWPKDCYVLEGKDNEPTIIYMPLFNQNNCKDATEFKERMEEFSTFQAPFSKEKILSVIQLAQENMRNNKETLIREIQKASVSRKNKRQPKEQAVTS